MTVGTRIWLCQHAGCGEQRAFRAGDPFRYYRNGPRCPVSSHHGYMTLVERTA